MDREALISELIRGGRVDMDARNRAIVLLKDAGMSFGEIGKAFGVSKQLAHKVYHRESTRGGTR